MDADLTTLIEVLSAEQRVFQRFFELLNEQQEALIKNNPDGIKLNIERMNSLAQEAATLEDRRRDIVARLSERLQMKPGDVSFPRLIEKFQGPKFKELERLKDTIMKIHEKITAQRNRNELLIGQSMRIIIHTMETFYDTGKPMLDNDGAVNVRTNPASRKSTISRKA